MIHRTPPLKTVDVITVLERSHRAKQNPVSEILRLFLVREIFPFPPIRRFQICLQLIRRSVVTGPTGRDCVVATAAAAQQAAGIPAGHDEFYRFTLHHVDFYTVKKK